MSLQTEFEFLLPKGYPDGDGNLHKKGIMRLATAADEILPAKDPRVQTNPSYHSVILLSRVVTKLGDVSSINPKIIESLFVTDLSYLQTLYEKINGDGTTRITAVCPKCENKFNTEVGTPGG